LTEVPDYLLERSRERRRALGLSDEDGGDAAPAAAQSTEAEAAAPPATTAAAAAPVEVAPAEPEVVEPDPPWVEAARTRHKIPMWVLPVLFLIPIWAYVYVAFLGSEAEAEGAVAVGQELFASQGCSGCHGSGGGGGIGYQLSAGEVLLTFPEMPAMLDWMSRASEGYGEGEVIGDPDRQGGPHIVGALGAAMPQFGDQLSPAQVYGVARYVRENLSGESPDAEELASRDDTFDALELVFGELTVDEALESIGAEPSPQGMEALIEAALAELGGEDGEGGGGENSENGGGEGGGGQGGGGGE
jgi:mono/diheme cytochrome c family protein